MSEEAPDQADEKGPTGFPEPPGKDPGDISGDEDPHHSLNNPVGEPDATEWPEPYENREDPRAPSNPADPGSEPHTPTGATSTSAPHPKDDLEAGDKANAPEGDDLDD